jgi:hypothetical protein
MALMNHISNQSMVDPAQLVGTILRSGDPLRPYNH